MATSNPIQLLISLGVNSTESRRNIQRSLDAIKNDLNLNLKVNTRDLNGGVDSQLRALQKLEYQLNRTTQLYKKAFDPTEAQRLRAEIQRLSNAQISNPDQLRAFQTQFANLRDSYSRFRTETVDASRANDSFGDSFTRAFGKFSVWLGVSTIFFGVARSIRDVTERVIELDTQLTSLRRVLDIPDANFNTILERSIENVTELSGRVTDYLQLVGDFGRTGLSDTEAIDLANTATLLQNISDINADQAFDSLTAAMISFGIAAEDSLRIADSLNEVNNIGLLLW